MQIALHGSVRRPRRNSGASFVKIVRTFSTTIRSGMPATEAQKYAHSIGSPA